MIALLVNLALNQKVEMKETRQQVCYYQQIVIDEKEKTIRVLGEHVMSSCKNLELVNDFFGADEALTDLPISKRVGQRQSGSVTEEVTTKEEQNIWHAIVIVTGTNEEEAIHKFKSCIERLKTQIGDKEWQFIEG